LGYHHELSTSSGDNFSSSSFTAPTSAVSSSSSSPLAAAAAAAAAEAAVGAGALYSQLINLAVLAELTLREVADCLLDPVCKTKQNKTKRSGFQSFLP
jgi:hypothetical protein